MATPTEVAETATAATTPTAVESTPEPEAVSDDELIAAALAQLEVDVAAGEIPDVMAFDLQGQKVADDVVTFTICAWAGDTVFDAVRDSLYRTTVNADGTVEAQHITTPLTSGECLNTELINTAFDFIDEYDVVRAEWSRDPALFANDERVNELLHPVAATRLGETLQSFVDDDVYYEPAFVETVTPDSLVVGPLYRRYRFDDSPLLDLVICRNVNPLLGKYRDGALIDDEKPDNGAGPHAVKVYELSRDEVGDGWLLLGAHIRGWANCDIPDLGEAIRTWIGGEQPFEEFDS